MDVSAVYTGASLLLSIISFLVDLLAWIYALCTILYEITGFRKKDLVLGLKLLGNVKKSLDILINH